MCVQRLLFTVSQRDAARHYNCIKLFTMASNNLSNSDVYRLSNGRKHKINTTHWKNVKNKYLRNSGKEYLSQSKKLVPAKTPSTVTLSYEPKIGKIKFDNTSENINLTISENFKKFSIQLERKEDR